MDINVMYWHAIETTNINYIKISSIDTVYFYNPGCKTDKNKQLYMLWFKSILVVKYLVGLNTKQTQKYKTITLSSSYIFALNF